MNIASFIEDFKSTDWDYLFITGSRLGNTSFITRFMQMVLVGEEAFESQNIDRLLDNQPRILYLRSMEPNAAEKKKIENLESVAVIEYLTSDEIFNYRDVLRCLNNRPYDYIIIDEVRQKYEDNRFEKFKEIIEYAKSKGMKLITSVTDDRQQKLDYMYNSADIIFEVESLLSMNVYEVVMENTKTFKSKTYTITMT